MLYYIILKLIDTKRSYTKDTAKYTPFLPFDLWLWPCPFKVRIWVLHATLSHLLQNICARFY